MSVRIEARILRGVAIYKFVKVAGLLVLASTAFELTRQGVLLEAVQWLARLPLVAGHEPLRHLLAAIAGVPVQRFELAGWVALAYAVLFGLEGYGLWRERQWAEILTVVATGSLIPFEMWALDERFTVWRLLALTLNISIVIVLGYYIRKQQADFASPIPETGR
jgi:uncharacterized membrane protein (DUF2068 family)